MIDPRRLALALSPIAAVTVLAWLAASAGPPAADPAGPPPTAAADVSAPPRTEAGDGETDDAQATPTPAAAAHSRQLETTPTPRPETTAPAAGPGVASVRVEEPVDPARHDAAAAAAVAWVAAFADTGHPDRLAVLHRHSHPVLAARLDADALPDAHTGARITDVEVTATSRDRVGVRVTFHTDQGDGHALEVVVAWHEQRPLIAEVRL